MLILTRERNESIVIDINGKLVEVFIVEIRFNRKGERVARLGFKAPDDVVIDRLEVHLAKKKERD